MAGRTAPGPALLALYECALAGDPAALARCAFEWLRTRLAFDAGMLVTTFAGRPGFLDAHFTGFADVAALMASWQPVAHLDRLAPDLVARPGVARRHDADDPRIQGPEFAPLHAHLERFGFRHTLCIALPGPDPALLTVIILVRHRQGSRAAPAELAALERMGPKVAAAYAASRSVALLRLPAAGVQHLAMARVDRRGAFVQTTPGFAQALWAGAPPQDVHLPAEAFRALVRGRPWPLPGQALTLHAQPDGDGWLLRLRSAAAADRLSPRERTIAQRFARGESYRAIAAALTLAPATVRNHLSNVYAKLGVRHRAALIEALG